MTYVSRKTRIIVSSLPIECDPELLIEAFRKRSDGRLKNYSSCNDLRAWINDNCVKNEYLLDLMSNEEFLGQPPYKLFGRYIPVPVLFKLLEPGKENDEKKSNGKKTSKNNNDEDETSDEESENLRIQWEKNQAEKNLLQCSCLLNTAIRRLEKLENMVEIASSETQMARAKEIKEAFRKAKQPCNCSDSRSSSISSLNNISENGYSSPVRKSRDSNTYNELMRKISRLKKKLKEVEKCRCQILYQIQKAEKFAPANHVKQNCNREDHDLIQKLQKELEKLIAEKGKLLSEMCNVLNSLKCLKISSRGKLNTRTKCRNSNGNCETFRENSRPKCSCKSFDTYESTDNETPQCMRSSFNYNCQTGRTDNYPCNYSESPGRLSVNYANEEPERLCDEISFEECPESPETSSHCAIYNSGISTKFSNRDLCSTSSQEKIQNLKNKKVEKKDNKEEKNVKQKKGKVKFVCVTSTCKKLYHDDLSAYENSLSSKQKAIIAKAVQSIQNLRPNTTPTTTREKRDLSLKNKCQDLKESEKIPQRRTKSETMIKEFEKTLRNYERRLHNLDSLECKVENLTQKSCEVNRLKKKLQKVKEEAKQQRAIEKDKFSTEVTRLCSENWELKKFIQQLTAKFDAQCKKIQILKCSMMRARELECETEDLKKELSEYRDGFEHQRKCITKWESVVAMQRTEIENLMNHIRKLTAGSEEHQCHACLDKKYVQRSRSYSPEIRKEKPRMERRKASKEFRMTTEEEESGCSCAQDFQLEGRKKILPRKLNRGCCPPSNGNIHSYIILCCECKLFIFVLDMKNGPPLNYILRQRNK